MNTGEKKVKQNFYLFVKKKNKLSSFLQYLAMQGQDPAQRFGQTGRREEDGERRS